MQAKVKSKDEKDLVSKRRAEKHGDVEGSWS